MYPTWMTEIRVGDVLVSGSGVERVVRARTAKTVAFAIRRCSWTGRCYTIYTLNDLRTFGFRPTGRRLRLRRKLDRAIARCIRHSDRERLTCCDVKGVP